MEYVLPILMLLAGVGLGGLLTWLVLRARIQVLTATLQAERDQTRDKLAVVEDAKNRLSDAFSRLAADALRANNEQFLDLAKTKLEASHETAKGDLDRRQQAIQQLVEPVRQSLTKVDDRIRQLEVAREGAYQGLKQQVDSLLRTENELRAETSNLVKALRRPEVRGRWGEIQLRRAVELAGMLDHCDFDEQPSTETEQGRLRPDLLIRLPGNFNIVVDSKTPLDAYLEALEAPDDQTRTQKLAEHARQVRTQISALAKKSYPEQFAPSLDFVVLFLPGEVFFRAAVEHDAGLIEFGIEQKVVIASPTTLISLLRAVACGWRQESLAQNAKRISDLGRELYERLAKMADHVSKIGRALGSAVDAYNGAVGSLESRVLVSARKFKELGAASTDTQIEDLSPVETTPRRLQSPELLTETRPDGRALEDGGPPEDGGPLEDGGTPET